MKVLHVTECLSPEHGGLPTAAISLAVSQAAAGSRVAVACHNDRGLTDYVNRWAKQIPGFCSVEIIPCDIRPSSLAGLVKSFDIVHVHGIWMPVSGLACWQAERLGRPVVIAPHGMLSTWSLQQKRAKKALALAVVWRRLMSRATVLHALNAAEAEELESRFRGSVIRTIPNGIFPSDFVDLPPSGQSVRVVPALGGSRRFALYLARLHQMKGPDVLVTAFSQLALRIPDLDLVIAGPDHGMERELRTQVARLGLADRVHLPGPIYAQDKLALLKDAVCLVQPSRHEGFSMSMIEALACGLPVVTTRAANFPEIETEGTGIIAAPDPDALGSAMAELATNAELRERQSRAARRLVDRCYTWTVVEARARHVYEYALAAASGARR